MPSTSWLAIKFEITRAEGKFWPFGASTPSAKLASVVRTKSVSAAPQFGFWTLLPTPSIGSTPLTVIICRASSGSTDSSRWPAREVDFQKLIVGTRDD